MTTQLFRKEAIEHQGTRLYGEVTLTAPVSTWVLTGVIGTIVGGILIILLFGEYARKETVSGWLRPNKGLVRVVSPQLAIVEAVHVEEGEAVSKGDALVTLSLDNAFVGGIGAVEVALTELEAQITERQQLIPLTEQRYEQDAKMLNGQLTTAETELSALEEQQRVIAQRIESANDLLERYGALAADGAATFLEVERQRENTLALEESATQISRLIDGKRGEVETYRNRLESLPLDSQTALAELREGLAGLRAQKAQLSRQGSIVMTAPVPGRVAGLPLSPGETLRPHELAVALLPEDGLLEAELFVPTRAVGFIKVGQEVRLQFHAFPFQRFGITEGRVLSVSKTIFEPAELPITLGVMEPVYRVRVSVARQYVEAYGERFPLQAGMTLSADIVQENRRLWEVLLDPLIARLS